jgi:nucleotide-binding universal stress UspA family protein
VFHVPESQAVPALYGEAVAEKMGLETPRQAREMVDRSVHEFQTRGLRAEGSVATRVGSTSELILDDVREFQADLVVIGSRGLSPFRGLLLAASATSCSSSRPARYWWRVAECHVSVWSAFCSPLTAPDSLEPP